MVRDFIIHEFAEEKEIDFKPKELFSKIIRDDEQNYTILTYIDNVF